MLKKSLPAMVLAGALMVPAGAALATTGATDEAPVQVTVTAQDQARQRLQVHDPATCGDCAQSAIQEQTRLEQRLQVQDPALCDGSGPLGGQGAGPGTGQGAGLGVGAGYGQGALDGTGPIHEGPADGTGNRFGVAGR